jgi:hypothetical protein
MERARGGVPSVGVVKRRVLRGLWRRLVGVGIIGTGLSGSGLYTVLGRAVSLSSPSRLARPSLCPVVRARDLGGATITIPGGAGTPYVTVSKRPRARLTGFYHGSEFPPCPGYGAPTFALTHPKHPRKWPPGIQRYAKLRMCSGPP